MSRNRADDRVLVTGGSGFLGTNLVDAFLRAGAAVASLDRVPPRNAAQRPCWIEADLRDPAAMTKAMLHFQPTEVIHMGARTDLRGKRLEDYDSNTTGVERVVDAVLGSPSIRRVIYASSMLVCRTGYRPTSDDDYAPSTVYGESKIVGERIVRQLGNTGPTWLIVRPTSIWGPWFGTPYREFFDAVLRGRFVNFGGAGARKTFGYVGNLVFQVESLLDAPGERVQGRTFYLGDRPPLLISEWAEIIAHEAGVRCPRTVPMWVARGAAKAGDLLLRAGVDAPISSFRLSNMTTENEMPLDPIYDVAGAPPYAVGDGVRETLAWLAAVAREGSK